MLLKCYLKLKTIFKNKSKGCLLQYHLTLDQSLKKVDTARTMGTDKDDAKGKARRITW